MAHLPTTTQRSARCTRNIIARTGVARVAAIDGPSPHGDPGGDVRLRLQGLARAVLPAVHPVNERLAYYAEHFDTVELNVTFYRMPAASAFRGWRDAAPDGFTFAVKASRYLTHIKRLEDPQASVDYLMERASILGDRLGPILLQLPPSLGIDLERLNRTLEAFGIVRAWRSSLATKAGSCRPCARC